MLRTTHPVSHRTAVGATLLRALGVERGSSTVWASSALRCSAFAVSLALSTPPEQRAEASDAAVAGPAPARSADADPASSAVVLDFAEHGQVVAVEVLRTPGVWEGRIVGGAMAGGVVMQVQTTVGEVLYAQGVDGSVFQSLPIGEGLRRVDAMAKLRECGGARASEGVDAGAGGHEGSIASNCDNGTVLDVLVKWTPAAQSEAGGPVAIRAVAEAAVAMSNHTYIASGVNVYMRGLGFSVTEPFSGDAGDPMTPLQDPSDGVIDGVHVERNALGADLVALLTGFHPWYCGQGNLGGTNRPDEGFSWTDWTCASNLTFTHEVGHNQGCCHAPGDGGGCFDRGVFPYSVGHRFYDDYNGLMRTVLAYPPGLRIPRLSSPLVPYLGKLTGLASADNARTVRETAVTMANFRCSAPCNALPARVRSPLLPCPAQAGAVTFTSTNVSRALAGTFVEISVATVGDLESSHETLFLRIGSTDIGVVAGGAGLQCEAQSRTTSVPASLFNAALASDVGLYGTTFTLRASGTVNPCQAGEVYVEMRYVASPVGCDGDFNTDGIVEAEDLAFVLAAWGPCCNCTADLNRDGVVNGSDLTPVLSGWGTCYGPTALDSLTPASGPTSGGTTITLKGSGLWGPTSVRVGGVECTHVQVVDSSTLTAVTPAGTVGARDVTVTTPLGTATVTGGFTYSDAMVPSWATLLEPLPDPAIVHRATHRAAIAASGFAWRVRDAATQIEMVLVPPGSYQRGCSPSDLGECLPEELPVHQVTLTQPFYMGRFEVTQAQWQAQMGSNPSFFQGATAHVPASQVPRRPVEQVSWNDIQGFLSATGMRLPTEAEWEYAYRAGTTSAFHSSFPDYPDGGPHDDILSLIAWTWEYADGQTHPVGGRNDNGFGLYDMSGNVFEWVHDWWTGYSSAAQTDPTGSATGSFRVMRGGAWRTFGLYNTNQARSSFRTSISPHWRYPEIGFRVARSPFASPSLTAVSPALGSTVGGTAITLTGARLSGATSVTVGGAAATSVQVVNDTTVTAVTPPGTAGVRDVTFTNPVGTSTLAGGFTYQIQAAGDECTDALTAVTGANAFSTVGMTTSADPVDASQCPNAFLAWGTANKDLWFRFVPPSSGTVTLSTCDLASFDTSMVLYSGSSCGTKVQIACNGDAAATAGCQSYYSRIGPVSITAGTNYWIRIGGYTNPSSGVSASGLGTLTVQYVVAPPTLASVIPASGPTAGGTAITLTGTALAGATSVTVGGAACTSLQAVSDTTLTAVTPASMVGARDVSVTTPSGTATRAAGYTYVAVPSWATLLEALPDPSVVANANLRAAITATGLPWRVRDTMTQIEMVLIPPGSFQMGCALSQQGECGGFDDEIPVHQVTLTQPYYMGRYEVTQAQWGAVLSNPSSFQGSSPQVPPIEVPDRPVESVSWNMTQRFLGATGMRLPTEAEWEYAYRAGTTTKYHSMPGYPNGTNNSSLLGNIAWWNENSGLQTRPVGRKAGNGFGLHDMSGNVWEWVYDWHGAYSSEAQVNPTGPSSGAERVVRGDSWGGFLGSSSFRMRFTPASATPIVGFRVVRTPNGLNGPSLTAVSPSSGPWFGGTAITLTGANLMGATSVILDDEAATSVEVVNGTTVRAVTTESQFGGTTMADVTVTNALGVAVLPDGFLSRYTLPGDECGGPHTAVIGANSFSTSNMSASSDPVDESQCPGTFLAWGAANKDVWFRFVPPSSGSMTLSTCSTFGFDTSMVLYSGSSCNAKVQIACNGNTLPAAGCQNFYSRIGPVSVTAGTTYWIRIGGYTNPSSGVSASGSGKLTVDFAAAPPTISAVAPSAGSTAGYQWITVTGTNLTGATSLRVGSAPCINLEVVNDTTLRARTPAGTAGVRDVSVTTPIGTVTLAAAYTYVVVPSWASLMEALPNPEVVTEGTLRAAIAATGLAWRVRDAATQIEMVLIPPGSYQMGCSPSQQWTCSNGNEIPVHPVTLTNAFYMGRYEVTQAQWVARMGWNPSWFQSPSIQVPEYLVPNRPVESVSWYATQEFLSGTGLRLPTEAEWEYAYRAGTTTAFHSMPGSPIGTNADAAVGNIAWFFGNANSQTRPVGERAGNGFGLHDMSGNVWEWVQDRYGPYVSGAQTNPMGPTTGTWRVIRGGGWDNSSGSHRSSSRTEQFPSGQYPNTGFRVAKNP